MVSSKHSFSKAFQSKSFTKFMWIHLCVMWGEADVWPMVYFSLLFVFFSHSRQISERFFWMRWPLNFQLNRHNHVFFPQITNYDTNQVIKKKAINAVKQSRGNMYDEGRISYERGEKSMLCFDLWVLKLALHHLGTQRKVHLEMKKCLPHRVC